MKKDNERLTFDAPKTLTKQIRTKAKDEGLSMSDIMRRLIKKGLEWETSP